MSEVNESKVIADGHRAAAILSDETFKSACDDARNALFREWETGKTVEEREAAHAALRALGRILEMLGAKQNAGVLTEHRAKVRKRPPL